MKITKETRQVEVTEQREVEEVVIRLTPDEARFLAYAIGVTSPFDRIKMHEEKLLYNSDQGKMARKVTGNPEDIAWQITNLYNNLVDKLS